MKKRQGKQDKRIRTMHSVTLPPDLMGKAMTRAMGEIPPIDTFSRLIERLLSIYVHHGVPNVLDDRDRDLFIAALDRAKGKGK